MYPICIISMGMGNAPAAQTEMLDEPDPTIHAAWAVEAKDRLAAFDKGEIQATPMEELIAKMRAV